MDYDNFYWISSKDEKDAARLSPVNAILDEKYFSNGEQQPLIVFQHEEGTKLCDIVDLSVGTLHLFSPKAIDLLTQSGVTGFATYEADLSNVLLEEIKSYKGLAIKGKCGPINHKLSKPATLSPVMPNAPETHTYLGMLFDIETWDGSDFFSPAGTSFTYVTKRVKDLFEQSGISNCAFKRITEIENYDLVMGFVNK